MKKLTIAAAALCALALVAQDKVIVSLNNLISEAVNSDLFTEMSFPDPSTLRIVANGAERDYALNDIESVSFGDGDDVVTVEYDGTTARVYNPQAFAGVDVTVDGADVTVVSTGAEEVQYRLTGSTTDGSFKIYSVVKYGLTLDGVSIANSDGAAINSQCKKKMTLVLADGTVNTLSDGSGYNTPAGEDEKGCLFSEGQIEVNGTGELRVVGNKKHAICTDDDFQMKSGTIVVTGAVTDGVHSKDAFKMSGGVLTISGTGGDCIDGDEGIVSIKDGTIIATASTPDTKAIAADSTFTVSGGVVNITLTGNQSKGFKSKQIINIDGGDITFNCSGDAVDVDGDMSFCTAVKSDSCIFMTNGTVTITHTGSGGKGFSADRDIEISGGTINATMSGDGGTYTTADGTDDTYSSHAITSDENMRLLGGTFTLSAAGKAGKCIKSDGSLVIGKSDGTGPTIAATTTGAKIGSSTSVGGGGRPGPGGWGEQGNTVTSSAKAIKCQGAFTMYGGDVVVSTATDGAEGIESKTSMDFVGGSVYIKSYDDAINSAGIIKFSGAKVYAWSTGNDAIDSNALVTGAITVSGGVVIAASSAGSPEGGLDADNAALSVSGGYLFTVGGSQGSGSSSVPNASTATQPTALATSLSLTQNQYVSVLNSGGEVLFSLLVPFNFSSSYSLVSCPGFVSGGTYAIVKGVSAPTGYESEWNGLYIGGNVSYSSTAKIITFTSNYVRI